MVVEPSSPSGAAVGAAHTADRRGKQLGREEASRQERQAVARKAARTLSEKLEQGSIG